ncbi:Tumor necrosis factor receptor superfamily member 11A Osteoclast differentiation factor receptor [Larimichthys crocea]|uniref:Tumor necrosis factor receptor superfamily member 11A Osteoclast differentiation factor receptor n=1 Tax=Larimichthys crocea TaxID=215358 RepID=A0A6G0IP99_LARCR|nr:Tumor necrosis factor receptor superfamily member 11A Osteoclast differentiation factor receptor [Larimichthys crocea]
MKTVIQTYKMMFGRNPRTAASLLIFWMNIFRAETCHRSEYLSVRNECCPMCPPGNRVRTDCTEYRSTSCQPCYEGTYMNQLNGLRNCLTCTNCGAGSGLKIHTACTTTSDTVCEPLEGFYCLDPPGSGCMTAREHTTCKPGQYISQKGTAFRDTVCSECSDGTYSNGTLTSCRTTHNVNHCSFS